MMMSFRGTRLQNTQLPLSLVWLLEDIAESKGRQRLFERQSPQLLKSLREMALIQSVESSNRIEGVTVEKKRLRPPIIGDAHPRDRSEEEIVGYRLALDWIHTDHPRIFVTPETCLRLHALAQGGASSDAEQWKTAPNDIIEILPDGRGKHDIIPWFTCFLSVWRRAYREFEDQAERKRPQRGSKTEMVEYALENIMSPFGIADVEQLCPGVSRDTIRMAMNRWRDQGRLEMLGRGRDARWRRKNGM